MFDYHDENIILNTILKLLIPFAIILGSYILVNGHLSPGGGFSGGTLLGTSIIMYNLTFGLKKTNLLFNYNRFKYLSTISMLIYALLKGASFMVGAAGNSLGIPLGTPGDILSAGLIPILNISVGLVVMGAIYLLFYIFSKGDVDE